MQTIEFRNAEQTSDKMMPSMRIATTETTVGETSRRLPNSALGPDDRHPHFHFQDPQSPILVTKNLKDRDQESRFSDCCVPLLPYTPQTAYDRSQTETEVPAVEVENSLMKVVIYPHLGGRLASLYDKIGDRELLFDNPVWPCRTIHLFSA